MKKIYPRGLSAPASGLHAFDHHFQRSLKMAWSIKAEFDVEPPWEGGKRVYINSQGHSTKMGFTLIYGKNLQKSFPTELIVL